MFFVRLRYFRLAESSLYVSGFRNSQFVARPVGLACLPSQRHGRFHRHHGHFILHHQYRHAPATASASAATVAISTSVAAAAAANWAMAAGDTYPLSFYPGSERNFRLLRRRDLRPRRMVSTGRSSPISLTFSLISLLCRRFFFITFMHTD